ncbi:MAG: GNAT family N-acetyltransferase [Firmicutes bacterium]|nr:GNAT family N-acetyltransferase [Bacillota bacterium]
MMLLRDVTKSDESIYAVWQNDKEITGYLSRLCPYNSSVGDYDTSTVCWFIIEEEACDIGSVWLEKDRSQPDTMILGIFISGEQYRGKGIGSKAIEEAIRISKQRIAFEKVSLNVRKSNLRAIHCYEKCSFRIFGEGQKLASDGTVPPPLTSQLLCWCSRRWMKRINIRSCRFSGFRRTILTSVCGGNMCRMTYGSGRAYYTRPKATWYITDSLRVSLRSLV